MAHIRSVSDFDDSAPIGRIDDISNLIALCPNHHWEFDHGIINLTELLRRDRIPALRSLKVSNGVATARDVNASRQLPGLRSRIGPPGQESHPPSVERVTAPSFRRAAALAQSGEQV